MSRTQVITAGYTGYGDPYREALGPDYEYLCISSAAEVEGVDWRKVYAVVFSGGADIDPGVYGETAEEDTFQDEWHDALDDAVIAAIAKHSSIWKFGTCRGAQRLFCTYLGGKLVQDIPHHYGGHPATLVPYYSRTQISNSGCVETVSGPSEMDINSIHHQGMRWDTVTTAEYYMEDDNEAWDDEDRDYHPLLLMTGEAEGQTAVEAWMCRELRCIGFQYHPEWLDHDSPAYAWTQEAIKNLVRKLNMKKSVWGFPTPKHRYDEDGSF